jgi:hypothetical protein
MNRGKKEKWLDELISRTINSGRPQFDVEKWKQKYPEEFQMLKSQARPASQTGIRWYCTAAIVGVAASLILLFSLFSKNILHRNKSTEMNTSPLFILPDYDKPHLKDTKTWNILPPFPN